MNPKQDPMDDTRDGEWDPQTAELRDGETTDVSSHAQGNIDQIRQAERDGYLDEDAANGAVERIKQRDSSGGV